LNVKGVILLGSEWRFVDLGEIDPISTQALYHAIAICKDKHLTRNTIIFCSPKKPLVCLGYHQELDTEVNVEYCSKRGLPIVRRILGGGAVYLDRNQLFYQIIASKSDPKVPTSIEGVFKKFLEAPTKTYVDIGIPAQYKPVNDIEVNGKKISGNGATEIDGTIILTGNLIFDFNFKEMTNILKVPSEKFRDKLTKSLQERLTTINQELTNPPKVEYVKKILKQNYASTLDIELIDMGLSAEEKKMVKTLENKYKQSEWLNQISNKHQNLIEKRHLKISGRSFIGETVQKTKGGLLRILVETFDDKIVDIMVTGDFTFIPSQYLKTLETELIDEKLNRDILLNKIQKFYKEYNIESPGMSEENLSQAIIDAAIKSQ